MPCSGGMPIPMSIGFGVYVWGLGCGRDFRKKLSCGHEYDFAGAQPPLPVIAVKLPQTVIKTLLRS